MVLGKQTLQSALSSPLLTPLWTPLNRECATVFTLHRFAVPGMGIPGHDPAVLAGTLERMRREGYRLLALPELLDHLEAGEGMPARAVAFTVDDGYFDFATLGAEVFLAYDCPVTVFLTTGVIDGTTWHWWDQIAYLCHVSDRDRLTVELGGEPLTLELGSAEAREAAARAVSVRCTLVPEADKWAFIAALSEAAGVAIPATPPAPYRGMSWTEVRGLESRGIRFGPHTVSHPVLIRTTDGEAAMQIDRSWATVRARLRDPVPVLAYPNGDFGEREMRCVREAGLRGAVTTLPVYARRDRSLDGTGHPGRIPRFPFPDSATGACLTASGFGHVAAGVRRLFLHAS